MRTRTKRLIAAIGLTITLIAGTCPAYAAGGKVTISIKNEPAAAQENLKPSKQAIMKTLSQHMTGDMLEYFSKHHGVIYVGTWQGAGYTLLAIDSNGKPMIPDEVMTDKTYPLEMHISNCDETSGYMDDYVLHEFGHVFDARYGITRNPQWDAVIASEMPAVQAVMSTITNGAHYTTTPEVLAQVYAAYSGGNDVVGGAQTLQAAPYTAGIIKAYEEGTVR